VAFEENSDAGRVVLVTGGQDGKALLWDADAGRLLATRADLDGCGHGTLPPAYPNVMTLLCPVKGRPWRCLQTVSLSAQRLVTVSDL